MIYKDLLNDVRGKKIAILGLGVSNVPLTKMLACECECSSITV